MPEQLLTITVVGNEVQLKGELDIASAPSLSLAIGDMRDRVVVLDVGGLSFIDARGVAAVVEAAKDLEAAGKKLEVSRATGIVRRVLVVTDCSDLLAD